MLRSFLPEIIAVAAINIRKGRRLLCQKISFKENLYMHTSFP